MSKVLFDTSSLLQFVRYYLPFDVKEELQDFLIEGFKQKEFLLLKEVENECKRVSQGLVFEKLLKPHNISVMPFNEIITDKLHREIDNDFIISLKKDKLEQQEYESQKQTFIQSADFRLIHYAIQNPQCTIITEESLAGNDNKLFKKIPKICEIKGIKCLSLPKFIQEKLKLSFVLHIKGRLPIL
ncbi:DUF4411 family protein [Campylobacter sp. MIT 21-1685]|uniref:DUF4411 family protein n=1 Tax=unclassified Campylobacter TaxID=2593542 RepID=UPI00224AB797|nr:MULTISPECIES: DUF4411 family protein [unclassified Campylobacter]MCX2683855.1 DUF4411 family protein [Campylobacter sp. MIT 21-1684]MCX2752139.1 DUF4411 family protein [Campylobacter sp. MIT 21-1682]MCX2808332.1 DUF4411 family protein [Campylobacter sp. MIT 21-1685]